MAKLPVLPKYAESSGGSDGSSGPFQPEY
jgi:hypothetical protein